MLDTKYSPFFLVANVCVFEEFDVFQRHGGGVRYAAVVACLTEQHIHTYMTIIYVLLLPYVRCVKGVTVCCGGRRSLYHVIPIHKQAHGVGTSRLHTRGFFFCMQPRTTVTLLLRSTVERCLTYIYIYPLQFSFRLFAAVCLFRGRQYRDIHDELSVFTRRVAAVPS